MQFKNVMCHCQQDGFCLYVDMPFCQEATVVPVSLDIGKSSLCLDAAVDTQLNAMFARDTRQVFLLFLLENLGHLEMFYALIKRLLAVVAMNAVRLARAVLATFAGVAGLLADKTSSAFCMTDAADHQLTAFAAQVGIFVRQVLHVLPTPDEAGYLEPLLITYYPLSCTTEIKEERICSKCPKSMISEI